MKDEIRRIMQLVQDGKLSPEDAAELIDAFANADAEEAGVAAQAGEASEGSTPPPPPPRDAAGTASKDPFRGFIDYVEGIGKELSESVDWKDVASQVRTGAQKGIENLREGIEKIRKEGRFNFDLFSSREVREIELPINIKEGQTLKIENPVGDIRIVGGSESGMITAQAKISGSDPEEARRRASEYTLIVEESDHIVLIKQPDTTGVQVDIEIAVPSKISVDAKTWSGNLTINDIIGNCRVTASSGNIRLTDIQGTVEVSSQNGQVDMERVRGASITLENKSGSVSLVSVQGNLNIRTASGSLSLRETAGKSVSIESVSGDVFADFIEPITGSTSIRTVNGSVTLGVPDECNCRVSLSTMRGTVHCHIPLQDSTDSEMRVTGTLGDGSGTLDVSAVNGSITMNLRAHS